MSLVDGTLEGCQVNLTHSPFADIHIDREAVCLLVVQHKMLQAACYAIGLSSLDIGDYHLACQHRVLTHILKGTAIQRSTLDINARTQYDVFSTKGKLLAQGVAIER